MILTRSSAGFPVDQLSQSGIVLFDTSQQNLAVITNSVDPATPQQIYPWATPQAATPGPTVPQDQDTPVLQETWTLVEGNPFYAPATPQVPTSFVDRGLTPGKFYYYSIFVFSLEEATPGWRLAGNCIGLVAADFGYGGRLFDLLPQVYQQQDQLYADQNVPAGPLERFLQVFGSQFDIVRTEQETLRWVRTPAKMSGGLLPLLASMLGTGYEGALGMKQARYKLANIVHLYKLKGTRLGIEGIVNAISGWDCAVDVSYNMLYDKNTSSFFEPFAATPQATPATPQNPTQWIGKKVWVPGWGWLIRTYIDRILNPYLDALNDLFPAKWLNNLDLNLDGRLKVNIHNQVMRVRRNAVVAAGTDDRLVVTHAVDGLGHLTGVKIRPTRNDRRRDWDWDDHDDRVVMIRDRDDDDICRHRHLKLVNITRTKVHVRIDEFGRVEHRPWTLRVEGKEKIRQTINLEEGQGAIDEYTITSTVRIGITGQALVTHDPTTPSRQARCYLDYYDEGGVYIASSAPGITVLTVATSWVKVTVTDPNPHPDAHHAALVIEWLGVGTVDIHYYKSVQIEVGCHRDDDDDEHLMLVPRVAHGQAPYTLTVTVAMRTPRYRSWRFLWGDGTSTEGTGRISKQSFSHTYYNAGHYRVSFRGVERDGDLERGHCKVHVSGPTMIYSSDEGVSASNGVLTTLSPFALARDVRIRLAPTRANQAVNPSFENDLNNWAPITAVNLVTNPGAETNASGWVGYYGTVGRTTAVSRTGVGALSLTCTNAGPGYMSLGGVGFSVTPGQTLHAEGWFRPATVPRNCYIQVDWRDINGNYLSSSYGPTIIEVVAGWTRSAGDFVVPNGIAQAGVSPVVLGSALGEAHYFDDIVGTFPTDFVISQTPLPVANPDVPYSQDCVAAYALLTPISPSATAQPSPLNDIDIYAVVPVESLTPYALSAYFLSSGEMRNVACEIEYLDTQGNNITKATWATLDHILIWAQLLGKTWEQVEENWIANAFAVDRANQWVRSGIVTVSPELATTARIHAIVREPSPGTTHYIDAVLFEKTAEINDYFDASALPGSLDYVWGGTAHASNSYWYPHRATKNNRLNQALPDFVPAGSTFSLVYGSDV